MLLSVTGVVTIGTLVGSMLPFFFKRIGLDPAVCSGPFIATFVDVSGIVLFFTLFRWIFGGYL
ncbi:MAG: Magnesium transporter MgtE [candidate division BRC1 bacterium ADurb.BinA292]|nr:MAG: Magnesium transporter MgtE [candidate division BRC1 bacterium ADurb.BinA292]